MPPSCALSTAASVVSTHLFGAGAGPIQLDDLRCQGNEATLLECDHSEFRVHNCYRHEEAAVSCRAGACCIAQTLSLCKHGIPSFTDQLQRCDRLNEPPSLPTETLTQ